MRNYSGEHCPLADAIFTALRGVWFPTHLSLDGRLTCEFEPTFPAPPQPWLLTIVGDDWHVTSNADYYATGGRLRAEAVPGRLTFVYPQLPPKFDTRYAYRLDGDELLLQSGGFAWSGPLDSVTATRYVRVAAEATAEMSALFAAIDRTVRWHPDQSEPSTKPGTAT